MQMVTADRRMTAGRRNLLQRLARSRMARDVRSLMHHVMGFWTFMAVVIGTWVMVNWAIDVGVQLLGRLMAWLIGLQ